jgi:hypothetical protein
MPNLNGLTTTLHCLNLQTNQTIKLARPRWGSHSQQINSYKLDR